MNFLHLKGRSIFIWGAGTIGSSLEERLKEHGLSVLAFCDSNVEIVEKNNIPVLQPVQLKEEIDRVNNSLLIIAVGHSIILEVSQQVEQLQIYDYFTHSEIRRILDKHETQKFYTKHQCHCCGCNACVIACPHNCIVMQEDEEGFKYPIIDENTCTHCNICENVCPILNKKHKNLKRDVLAYAAITKNEKIREDSSSGGLFTEFAEYFIRRGGIVFGAVFDENLNVIHDYADNLEKLSKMRGSKYVESDVNNTYEKAKYFLEKDRLVMYTGTPCQIGGLYSYLGKDYENLFTQDIICHGVASPKVWRKYLLEREKEEGFSIVNVAFRSKKIGWREKGMCVSYSNGMTKYYPEKIDDMYLAFKKNISLRPSCYACSFKEEKRQSDITIGDFWGIEHVLQEMDDDKGTSMIFINSPKGEKIYAQILSHLKSEPVDPMVTRFFNTSFTDSVSLPPNNEREKFFKNLMF